MRSMSSRARISLDGLARLAAERSANSVSSRTATMNSSVRHMPQMEVERPAVDVARRVADHEEVLDLRMVDVHVDRSRAAADVALADGERHRVLDLGERHRARGLAAAGRLADRAQAVVAGADAAALGTTAARLRPAVDDRRHVSSWSFQVAVVDHEPGNG